MGKKRSKRTEGCEGAAGSVLESDHHKGDVVETVLTSERKGVGTCAFLYWMYQPETHAHTVLCVMMK